MPLEEQGSLNNPYLLGTVDMGQDKTKVIEFDKIINSEYKYTLKIINGPGILTGTNFSYTSQHDEVGIKTFLLKFEDEYKQEMYLQFSINVITNKKVFIDTDSYGRVKNEQENIYSFNIKAGETFSLDLSQYTTDSRNQFPLKYYLKDKENNNRVTLKGIDISKDYDITFTEGYTNDVNINGIDIQNEYDITFRKENDENKEIIENVDLDKEYIIQFSEDPDYNQNPDIGTLNENTGLYTWDINNKLYGRYNIQFIVEDINGNKQSQYIEINIERLSIDSFILDTDGFLTTQYIDINKDFYFNLDKVNLNPYKEETTYQLITETGMIFSKGGDYFYHLPQGNYAWDNKIIEFKSISSDNIETYLKIKLIIVQQPEVVKQINPQNEQIQSLKPIIQWYPADIKNPLAKVSQYDIWLYQKPDDMPDDFIENLGYIPPSDPLSYPYLDMGFARSVKIIANIIEKDESEVDPFSKYQYPENWDDPFTFYAINIQNKTSKYHINSYTGQKIYYNYLQNKLVPNKKYYLRIDSWSIRGIKNTGEITTFYTHDLTIPPIKEVFDNGFNSHGWEYTNNVLVKDVYNMKPNSNQYPNVVNMSIDNESSLIDGYYTEELKLHVSILQPDTYLYFNYINLDDNQNFDIFINQLSIKNIPYSDKWKREIIHLPIGEYDLSFKLRKDENTDSSLLLENININTNIEYNKPIIISGYPNNTLININESFVMNQIDTYNDKLIYDLYLGESKESLSLIYSDIQVNNIQLENYLEENKKYYWKFIQKKKRIDNGLFITKESDIYEFSTKSEGLEGDFHFNASYNYLHNNIILKWMPINEQNEYYIYRKKKS